MTRPALIMTRPVPASQRFVDGIRPDVLAKVALIISPLLRISSTDSDVDMARYAGAIFTSANGVDHAGPGNGSPAYCVGSRTAETARKRGWDASISGQTAEELIQNLANAMPAAPLVHIGGVHQRGDIAARLTTAGLHTNSIAVYDQQLLPLSAQAQKALSSGTPCIVPLFSPRTAMQFAAECADMQHTVIIALSNAVALHLAGYDTKKLFVSGEPSAAAMHIALETAVDWVTLP
jgi:uroporphyrinogen-III synthase